MEDSRILNSPSPILAGDLNCNLGIKELWGQVMVVDKMAKTLREIILSHSLIDVFPQKKCPHLDNGRSGNI